MISNNIVLLPSQQESMDEVAEKVLLGCIIKDSAAIAEASSTLIVESFGNIRNQLIYEAMLNLYRDGNEVVEVAIGEKLEATGNLEKAGGYPYIAELSQLAPFNANIPSYIKIIEKYYYKRRMVELMREFSRRAGDPKEDPQAVINILQQNLTDLSSRHQKKNLHPLSEIAAKVIDDIKDHTQQDYEFLGLESGFAKLDEVTMGLQSTDLIVIAARPSMGKTAFALNIASYAALYGEQTVFFFSLEMSKEQLAMRVLSSEVGISAKDLKRGKISTNDWTKISKVAARMDKAPLYINDTAGLNIVELISLAKAAASSTPPNLIVVDYLQLIRSHNKNFNREQEIAEISRSLKALAKNLNVPIIAVSQLNRGPEARANKRPNMADIRESGAIEQDADIILFLYRDEVYNAKTFDIGIAEVIIGKHRNGEIGTIKLNFDGQFTKFANREEDLIKN